MSAVGYPAEGTQVGPKNGVKIGMTSFLFPRTTILLGGNRSSDGGDSSTASLEGAKCVFDGLGLVNRTIFDFEKKKIFFEKIFSKKKFWKIYTVKHA